MAIVGAMNVEMEAVAMRTIVAIIRVMEALLLG